MRTSEALESPHGESQRRTAAVGACRPSLEQSPGGETLHDPAYRARMQVHETGETPGGQPGKATHEAQGEPLRTGDPKGAVHPLRGFLKRVIERPELAQEVEFGPEILRPVSELKEISLPLQGAVPIDAYLRAGG